MMKKYILVFTILFLIDISFLRADLVEEALSVCSAFNNECEVMSCRMSPLAGEVILSFEKSFNQLEKNVLSSIDSKLPSSREKILVELSDLKSSKNILEINDIPTQKTTPPTPEKLEKIQKLEKELLDLESILNANPKAKKAMEEITIVRERLKHLKAGIYPRGVITVPGGSFRMGENNDTLVTLRPFIAAQTHVTQGEWKQLSEGINPSNFKGDRRPVESLTWASMVMYMIKLNEKLGLEQPVDISQMDPGKFNGKWEKGTLDFKGEESKIKFDLKKKGYRAPTDAEWEYILKNLGKSTGEYPHSLKEEQFGDYIVYRTNSNNQTAEVRSKKAFEIEGREIYDAAGNVWIWTLGGYQEKLLGGDNPLELSGNKRVLRGGSWLLNAKFVRSALRSGYGTGFRSYDAGFRVVRTF